MAPAGKSRRAGAAAAPATGGGGGGRRGGGGRGGGGEGGGEGGGGEGGGGRGGGGGGGGQRAEVAGGVAGVAEEAKAGGAGGMREMCITLHQPWASLLVAGIKRVEGRSWPTHYRGRLWIHAGAKKVEPGTIPSMERFYRQIYEVEGVESIEFPDNYPLSALLGCVSLVECLSLDETVGWEALPVSVHLEAMLPYCWLCERPQKLSVCRAMKGQRGLYPLDWEMVDRCQKALSPVSPPLPFIVPQPYPFPRVKSLRQRKVNRPLPESPRSSRQQEEGRPYKRNLDIRADAQVEAPRAPIEMDIEGVQHCSQPEVNEYITAGTSGLLQSSPELHSGPRLPRHAVSNIATSARHHVQLSDAPGQDQTGSKMQDANSGEEPRHLSNSILHGVRKKPRTLAETVEAELRGEVTLPLEMRSKEIELTQSNGKRGEGPIFDSFRRGGRQLEIAERRSPSLYVSLQRTELKDGAISGSISL